MMFWTLVGIALFIVVLVCVVLTISMLMATRDTDFD